MTNTPNLALPYIDAAQAQKHVTHNEALRGLDALVQTAIVTRALSAAPGTPADGACYILSAAGTGGWAGQPAATVAAWQDGIWVFYPPKTGWLAWVADEATTVTYTGTAWQIFGVPPSVPQLGINTTADATNRLAVKSPAILFDNTGNGAQVKINKAAATDTASLLYQDGYSGRVEMGLASDDDFHLKVSPDGSVWKEALRIDRTSGLASAFGDPAVALGIATKQYVDAHSGLVTPGGSSGQIQYNNSGALGGFTASGDASINGATGAVTIAANAVTNAKAAQMAAGTLKGNSTGASANPADLSAAQAKALLAISSADVSGLGALAAASSVSLTSQATGTLQAAQEPAHTGDVTNLAGSLALTIAANAVTNAKAAQMAAATLKGNNTGATANAFDLTAAQVKALLAISSADVSGLGALAAASSVSLTSQVTGTLQAAQEAAHTGDVTNPAGSLALTIAANAVTNAKSAQMAAGTLKGNSTGASANAADLSATQAKALLAISSADVSGLGALAAASSVSLTSQATGTLQEAQEPAHTGDVTNPAGNLALTIAANAVTNAKAAQMAAATLKGNNTGAVANALDLTAAQVKALLTIAAADVSGLATIATTGNASDALWANSVPQVGINATADTTNRLAVASAASLFNHTGAGHQLKLNKAAAANTASVLYQDNFSGRAEIGLTGDDNFHFKVSPDGATFKEALLLDRTSGLGTVFGDPAVALGIATKQYVDARSSGAAAITEIEIDFGASAVRSKKFLISDAAVLASSKVVPQQSGKAATGRQADENEMDMLHLRAAPAAGTFTLYAACLTGRVNGKFKINYQVG